MPTPYSPGLEKLIAETEQSQIFAANVIGLRDYNASLGIRDGENVFLSPSYRVPTRERMDFYVRSLNLTPAEMDGYLNSRLRQFLYRSTMTDPAGYYVPEETMKILIALHLAFGEQVWNRARFPNSYGKQCVELDVSDDHYLEWTANSAGELTPFGLSVLLLRSRGWFDAMLAASHDNSRGIRISELAFAAVREHDCFKGIVVRYGHRHTMGINYSKTIETIRSYVNDGSAVAWVVLWDAIKPPEAVHLTSKNDREASLRAESQFLETIRGIGDRASFDEVRPYITSAIRHDAETIISAARSGLDVELIESMADGSGEIA